MKRGAFNFIGLKLIVVAAAALALAGCQRAHSALAPATSEAAGIAKIWWVFFALSTAVYLIIVALVIGAAVKHRRSSQPIPVSPLRPEPATEMRIHRTIMGATV